MGRGYGDWRCWHHGSKHPGEVSTGQPSPLGGHSLTGSLSCQGCSSSDQAGPHIHPTLAPAMLMERRMEKEDPFLQEPWLLGAPQQPISTAIPGGVGTCGVPCHGQLNGSSHEDPLVLHPVCPAVTALCPGDSGFPGPLSLPLFAPESAESSRRVIIRKSLQGNLLWCCPAVGTVPPAVPCPCPSTAAVAAPGAPTPPCAVPVPLDPGESPQPALILLPRHPLRAGCLRCLFNRILP